MASALGALPLQSAPPVALAVIVHRYEDAGWAVEPTAATSSRGRASSGDFFGESFRKSCIIFSVGGEDGAGVHLSGGCKEVD